MLFAYRASLQESTKESPFYLLYGCDPKLPTALELGRTLQPETNLDTYKGEVALSEAWKLARNNIKTEGTNTIRYNNLIRRRDY